MTIRANSSKDGTQTLMPRRAERRCGLRHRNSARHRRIANRRHKAHRYGRRLDAGRQGDIDLDQGYRGQDAVPWVWAERRFTMRSAALRRRTAIGRLGPGWRR